MMYRNPNVPLWQQTGRVLAGSALAIAGLVTVEGCGGGTSSIGPNVSANAPTHAPAESPEQVITTELVPHLSLLASAAWQIAPADGRYRSYSLRKGSDMNRYEMAFRLPQHQAAFIELNAQGTAKSFNPSSITLLIASLVNVPKGETALPTSTHLQTVASVLVKQRAGTIKLGGQLSDPEETFMTPPNSLQQFNVPGTIEERQPQAVQAAIDALNTVRSTLQNDLATAPQPLILPSS